MTIQKESPPPGWTPPQPTGWDRIPGAIKVLGAVIVIALIVAGIVAVTGRDDDGSEPDPAKSSDAAAGKEAGVVFSTIASNSGGSDKLAGFPIGFPHTETGAVQAAFSYDEALSSPAMFVDESGAQLMAYMAPGGSWPDLKEGLVMPLRERGQINESGEPLAADGSVDPNKKFVADVLREYGAFRVTDSSADQVTVEIWAPTMLGVTDGAEVQQPSMQYFALATSTVMTWSDDDWRIDWAASKPFTAAELPQGLPAVSFAFRAENFPAADGWKVPADATQSLKLPHGLEQAYR